MERLAGKHRPGHLPGRRHTRLLVAGFHFGANFHRHRSSGAQRPPQPAGRSRRRAGGHPGQKFALQPRLAERGFAGHRRRGVGGGAQMTIWLIILAGGVITYAIRLSFILLLDKINMPGLLRRSLQYVPVAVFSAIIFPMVFVQDEQVVLSPVNPRLISAIVAALVAWRTRNIVLTILAGMLVLFLVQALI